VKFVESHNKHAFRRRNVSLFRPQGDYTSPVTRSANFTLFRLAEAEPIKVIGEGDASRSFGKQLNYFRQGKGELVGNSFVSEVHVLRHVL